MYTLTIIYQKNPQPGQWKLEKKSAYSWVINVTAQSALGFTATILETSTDGNSYHLSGNPIKGTFFRHFHAFSHNFKLIFYPFHYQSLLLQAIIIPLLLILKTWVQSPHVQVWLYWMKTGMTLRKFLFLECI